MASTRRSLSGSRLRFGQSGSGIKFRKSQSTEHQIPDLGLQCWLAADGQLWQDSARTTPAVADADPVGAWDDKSGLGINALQATAGLRPLYKTGIQNGRPAIRFDGTDDFLATAAFSADLVQPHTTFLVFKFTSTATRFMTDGIAAAKRGAGLYRNGANFDWFAGLDTNLGAADTSWHVAYFVSNGASSIYRFDAGVEGTIDPGTNLLSGLTLGASYDGSLPVEGDMGELIIYNRVLSTNERIAVERYLGQKWGITVA